MNPYGKHHSEQLRRIADKMDFGITLPADDGWDVQFLRDVAFFYEVCEDAARELDFFITSRRQRRVDLENAKLAWWVERPR